MKPHHSLIRIVGWFWVALSMASCNFILPTPAAAPEYWPTSGWRTSTPEQQGMDSAKLTAMLAEIQDKAYPIHGMVVIRNGYLVLEMYKSPFKAESRHYIASATKSFTSALVGIAIQQGKISGLDAHVLDYFPGRTFSNPDARKQDITLEDLLTMSSGLDWPTQGLYESLAGPLQVSQDGVKFVLDRAMASQPGTQFNYNTGGSLLLSAALSHATGKSALEYAQQNIFTLLGISNVLWPADASGISPGGSGLELAPRDMAKFGYLYLKDGVWDSQAVIPPQWVKTSSAIHIKTGYVLDLDYGYHWWVHPSGVYHARGYGGQRIFVLPEQQMVVVFVSGFYGNDMEYVPDALLNNYIIPAAQSKGALPRDAEKASMLAARVQAIEAPAAKPIGPMPATAARVSGKTYTLQPNSLGVTALGWRFSDKQAWVEATFGKGSPQTMSIGLDEVYRATGINMPGSPVVTYYLKGTWVSDDTFILYAMRDGANAQMKIVFKENGLEFSNDSSGSMETVSGTLNQP